MHVHVCTIQLQCECGSYHDFVDLQIYDRRHKGKKSEEIKFVEEADKKKEMKEEADKKKTSKEEIKLGGESEMAKLVLYHTQTKVSLKKIRGSKINIKMTRK